NILDLKSLPDEIDIIIMDVSFVSIKKIIPAIKIFLNKQNYMICLIKPQYEYGKLYNKGIIKNNNIHEQILNNVRIYLEEDDIYINKLIPSPITGGSGNVEFLALLTLTKKNDICINNVIKSIKNKKGE
ncbi:MAG: TlyA family rRNA (cytidine-2'-O)-methyltransferase, partial [Anaeroplasmataceae bacterium]